MFRSLNRRLFAAAIVGSTALTLLSGCGGGTPSRGGHNGGETATPTALASATQPGADHNQADVTFAQSMIPHHQQAIAMAKMAEARASNPQVKELAAAIRQAQEPEIAQLTQWLRDWGEPAPSSTTAHGMPGTMTTMTCGPWPPPTAPPSTACSCR